MEVIKSENIRNICITGHGGSGKTTFAEGVLFASGVVNRFGKVEEGNTVSDYHKDEVEKQLSINSSLMNTVWKGSDGSNKKLNIIDTPGFMDFVGEVKAGLRVTDTALILVDAFKGIEVGTESSFMMTNDYENNVIFLVNKLDTENADFDHTASLIQDSFGSRVAVVQFPVNQGTNFDAVVDVIRMKLLRFNNDGKGEYTEEDIPPALMDKAKEYHQKFVEVVAEEDEELLNKFFEEGANLTDEEIDFGLKKGMRERKLFPVFCISAEKNIGTRDVLDFISNYTESPMDKPAEIGHSPNSEDPIEILPKADGEPVMFIFKTVSEKNIGELSFFRVYSGKVKAGMDMINEANGKTERLSQMYSMNGKDRKEMGEVVCGDIAAVVKLKDSHTNNTLSSKNYAVVLPEINFPKPNMSLAIHAKNKGDDDKIASALHSLHEEDPTFLVAFNPETGQTIISGQGEIHLNTILNRMKSKYNFEVDVTNPKIAYRETIRSKVDNIEYKHKKQSGGRGQFGHVLIKIEPVERGKGFEFVNAIVGGVVPGRFIPAVEKGIQETLNSGVLIGNKVIDVKVTLFDGSYHNVDSDEISFRIAASQAFKKGFKDANPVILEPVYNVEVVFPEEFMGAVSGDISSRRGRIQGMDVYGKLQKISCQIPLSEMSDYSTKLRSITQGRGYYDRNFSHYEDVPKEVEVKIIAEYESQKAQE
ncbi:MAG: elongation factor G [Ignavibacteria bacterium]|nr:elongation factor G [Ignavibacteria bacterium]MBK9406316.1 elongation factor G [Ignavibacteria bacterium]